jgi:MoaA/NifB/PqqE/SkfB family radical SAM enzyme
MEELNNLIRDKNKLLVLGGILHSSRAFVGPEVLHVDLTNHCNFDCIACWCRSPLLRDKAMPDWEKKLTLPLDLIKSVFDDLSQMGGLRQVKLVGGGEPFMHPNILEIVEYIKNKDRNIEIDINTNFSLLDEKVVKKVFDLEVDSFTVSLWAGTPEAYTAVHPNQSERTFYKIKEMLNLIFEKKRTLSRANPRILIHDVIFSLNYRDVKQMVEFALETGADSIQFVPVDPVKGRTDTLLLGDSERKELLDSLLAIKSRYDEKSFRYISQDGRSLTLPDFDGFIRRTEKLDTRTGAYDEEVVEEFPCYVGWLFARIMTTGNVVPCCKGHRMVLGNIYKNSFREIWFSQDYNEFRHNCINLSKCHPYFSRIGNDAVTKTGCYNCDNLWQNIPTHKKVTLLKNYHLHTFCSPLLQNLYRDEKQLT